MTLLRRCELNMEPTWMTLQVDKSKHDKAPNKVLYHLSFKMFISSFGQLLWEYSQEFSKVMDCHRKIWLQPLKGANLGVAQAFLDSYLKETSLKQTWQHFHYFFKSNSKRSGLRSAIPSHMRKDDGVSTITKLGFIHNDAFYDVSLAKSKLL